MEARGNALAAPGVKGVDETDSRAQSGSLPLMIRGYSEYGACTRNRKKRMKNIYCLVSKNAVLGGEIASKKIP